jgi:hypothetical protein
MKDRAREAGTLCLIGGVYAYLDEKRKALEYFSQALDLSRAAGDQEGEASVRDKIDTLSRRP